MRSVHGRHRIEMAMTQLAGRRIHRLVASKRTKPKSVLQSRWLLMALVLLGATLGVEAALRLDDLVAPSYVDFNAGD